MDERDHYLAALLAQAEAAIGEALGGRTVVCPDPERSGGRTATSYPMPAGTVIWCDPALVDSISELLAPEAGSAITTDRWIELAQAAGAEHLGSGNNRVLVGALSRTDRRIDDRVHVRVLDRNVADDVETLRVFADAASEDDLDEADLDLDELDPLIVGLFEGDTMLAYGSGRPHDEVPEFDDIGVLTSAEHRGRGLGARVVSEFVDRRTASDPTRRMLYRCNVENVGSNGVAESLGFTLVHTIGACRFPE